VNEAVVTDSTCLIGLERINRLDLLPALFDVVWIPPEVEREFGASYDWLQVEAPTDTALVNALKLMVDDGEAEAIALAGEKQLKIIVDDRQARAVAKRLGLSVIGTVGCFLRAKQAGILPAIRPLIEALENVGFHLGDALKEEALRLAGE
jgi:uncharacterized protein